MFEGIDAMSYEKYPRNFEEFVDWFQNEEDCFQYIAKVRWPNGFTCPRCHYSKSWRTKRNVLHCAKCGHQSSITAGSVFQDSRKPLRLWFYVMWWLVSQKTGVSAKNLEDNLGFGSYKTAWTWLHKLRRVMIRPGRDRLHGTVEVDETYIGTEGENRGRKINKKSLVVVAVESKTAKEPLGRVRFRCIPDASSENLSPFIEENIEPGSTVKTDGWNGYVPIDKQKYNHVISNIAKSKHDAVELLPKVHLVVALLKRWLMGTYQGAVSQEHLQYYLDEYAFRFNRRLSRHKGKLFYRLIQQAVTTEATPLWKILANRKSREAQDMVVP